jgi:RNA polymerase sigma factor (sigma-70 family)
VTVEELYRRLSPDVFRFALRLSGNEAVAEDLVADAFVVALEGPPRREVASARALLFGAVRNLHLHVRRERARRPSASAAELEGHATAALGPEGDAASRSGLRQALQDLQTLAEESRSAVLLRAEGLPYDEIAQALGITPGAAKVGVHRARVTLSALQAARESRGDPK